MTHPRIVSLLASGTEISDAIGLGGALVGISHECDFPAHVLDRPRLSRARFDPEGLSSGEIDAAVREAMAEHGSVYEIDGELLASLQPDLILTQAVCEVCAVPTSGVQRAIDSHHLAAEIVSLDAHTIEEILASIEQVGRAAGVETVAKNTVATLRSRLRSVRTAVETAARPRVLAVEWLDPPFAPGHWVPEMIDYAGGECVIGEAGKPSLQLRWEDLEGLDPDILVIMPCGYGLEAACADADAHADRLESVAARAIGEGRAYALDASAYLNRSGPRFVTGVEILAGLFDPSSFEAPTREQACVWTP